MPTTAIKIKRYVLSTSKCWFCRLLRRSHFRCLQVYSVARVWIRTVRSPNVRIDNEGKVWERCKNEQRSQKSKMIISETLNTMVRYDNCMHSMESSWNVLLMNVMLFFHSFYSIVHLAWVLFKCDLINWICLCRLEPFGIWILNIVVISTFCCVFFLKLIRYSSLLLFNKTILLEEKYSKLVSRYSEDKTFEQIPFNYMWYDQLIRS